MSILEGPRACRRTVSKATGGGGAVILDRTTIQGSTVQAVFTNGDGSVFSYGNNPINDNAALGVTPTVTLHPSMRKSRPALAGPFSTENIGSGRDHRACSP